MCSVPILGSRASIAMVVKLRSHMNITGLDNLRTSVYFQQSILPIEDDVPSAKNRYNYNDLTPFKKLRNL